MIASTFRPAPREATNSGSSGSPNRTKSAGTACPRRQGLACSSDPGVDGRRRTRPSDEDQVAAAQLQEVLGQQVAAGEIVDADDVELAARGKAAEITVQQGHGDSRLTQTLGQLPIHGLLVLDVFERGKEDACHLAPG